MKLSVPLIASLLLAAAPLWGDTVVELTCFQCWQGASSTAYFINDLGLVVGTESMYEDAPVIWDLRGWAPGQASGSVEGQYLRNPFVSGGSIPLALGENSYDVLLWGRSPGGSEGDCAVQPCNAVTTYDFYHPDSPAPYSPHDLYYDAWESLDPSDPEVPPSLFCSSSDGYYYPRPSPSPTISNPCGVANLVTSTLNHAGWYIENYGDFCGISIPAVCGARVHIPDDTLPPTTTATPSPAGNANGWNKTNVTVNLKAIDNPGGSGVKQIEFALGGAQNTGWQTVPGNVMSTTISTEGTTILTYLAKDYAGNQETAKTLTVNMDKTPPVISGMPAPDCTIWPPNDKLVPVATVSARDGVSGLVSTTVTGTSADPANGRIVITGGPARFQVQLGAHKDEIYALTATATDLAGNTATATATCSVPHAQGE